MSVTLAPPPVGAPAYERQRAVLLSPDAAARRDLAAAADTRPEILYFLADDRTASVRQAIAANPRTPEQVDAKLVRDPDEQVREALAGRIARLLPDLPPSDRDGLRDRVIGLLETLARDEASRVRRTIAEALKDVSGAPPGLIGTLARDIDLAVAEPVLRFSPLLSDGDLLDIIAGTAETRRLAAIAGRPNLQADVSDALVGTDNESAVAALLANPSAQIREETLDLVLDRATETESWHAPLAERPGLTSRAAGRIASFLSAALLERFQRRDDLAAPVRAAIEQQVEKRLTEDEPARDAPVRQTIDEAEAEARRLHAAGKLEPDAVAAALSDGRRAFVKAALAVRGGLSIAVVEKILAARSAKGVVALAWKAALNMPIAVQLQQRMGGIVPRQVVRARPGHDWPLTADELAWHLELFDA